MTRLENLLTVLSEECAETAQTVTKTLRFGLDNIKIGQDLTNAERIVHEFNDIVAVMELLHEAGIVDKVIDRDAIEKKKLRVAKYLDYSINVGTVTE